MEKKYRIKELRENLNISQDKLSKIIGVSRTQIIRWETISKMDKTLIDSYYKNRLCKCFNVPLRDLYNCDYEDILSKIKDDAQNVLQNTAEESKVELMKIKKVLSELILEINQGCEENILESIENNLYQIVKVSKTDIFLLFDFLSEVKINDKTLSKEIEEEIRYFLSYIN